MLTPSFTLRFGLVSLAALLALAALGGLLSAFAAGPAVPSPFVSGALAGRVTDAQTHLPVSGSAVAAYDAVSGVALADGLTDAAGNYTVPVTTAYGSVKLKFDYGAPYALVWYPAAHTFSRAAALTLSPGPTLSNLNLALAPAGQLSATVTVGAAPPPAGGILQAQFYEPDGDFLSLEPVANGQLRAWLPPGAYRLRFSGDRGVPGWYASAADFAGAAPITIVAGITTPLAIDLAPGGVITGRLTDALTGLPLASFNVGLFDALGQYLVYPSSYVAADANGVYTVSGLATGGYRLSFRAPGHQSLTYGGGLPVSVTAGTLRGGVDASLMPLAVITGSLTRHGGQPLGAADQVTLRAYFENSNLEAGRVTLVGPPLSGYQLLVQPGVVQLYASGPGLSPEWYDNLTIRAGASPLTVAAGQTLSQINIDLALGTGCVTGAVTGPGGPLSGVSVQAFDAHGDPQPPVGTQADGSYRVCGLAAGLYRLAYAAYPYPLQWDGGQAEPSLAPPIVVEDGLTTTVDAQFGAGLGGCVAGSVLGPDGLVGPSTFRYLLLRDAHSRPLWFYDPIAAQPVTTLMSGFDGRFVLCGLPAGSYDLIGYEDSNFDGLYGPTDLSGQQPVVVAAGQAAQAVVQLRLRPWAVYLPRVER